MDEPQFRSRPRSRRWFLWAGAGTVGAGAGVAVLASGVGAAPAAKPAAGPAASGVTAAADPVTVEPVYGAGVFDVDPDQTGVSQSASVVVTGDVDALPLDMDL
jgi:hypothetical protein